MLCAAPDVPAGHGGIDSHALIRRLGESAFPGGDGLFQLVFELVGAAAHLTALLGRQVAEGAKDVREGAGFAAQQLGAEPGQLVGVGVRDAFHGPRDRREPVVW